MKRMFDVFLSLVLIVIFILPMSVISIYILVTMGRPVIFKQARPGLNAKVFYINKFRTMTNEKNENGELLPNEQRITKTGKLIRKLSLDELPQLFNVLKGEMSFVGPRPLLVEYLPLYSEEQSKRHNMRPGITGWAQVNGRNNISWEKRFELDVWYVENRTFLLDLKIIFMTALKVFKRADVNPDEKEFVDKFKGSNLNE